MINDRASTEVALKFALDGAYLPIGQTGPHETCPVCNGGSSSEKSFVIRRVAHDLVTFRCYRAACGASGCISISNGTLVSRESKSQKRVVSFSIGGFDLLSEEQIRLLENKYNCSRLALLSSGVRVDSDSFRVMLPLYDTDSELRGYILRWHEGISTSAPKPKALTCWLDETPRIAFPSPRSIKTDKRRNLVLFEDWNSAHRVARAGVPAAAINGTGLSVELLRPLALAGYDNVILCLDADAKSTALRHKLQFSSMFRNFSVFLLSNLDVKDMNSGDFDKFMAELGERCVK